MTTINLLPWREKARKQQKQNFILLCALAVGVAFILNVIIFVMLQVQINKQERRNGILQQEKQINSGILAKKKKFETDKSEVLSQIATVKELNNQRYRIVEIFNAIPRLLPNGVYITSINVQKELIELQGYAATEIQISELAGKLKEQPGWRSIQLQEAGEMPGLPNKTKFRITLNMD
ncbi:MAG: pilus assembly protein PilN [Gammaproteobacteria bacterium]|jgi:type IV pilus assembly protein PilN|nr:pilus assembly protein PilN [Gammaproteobacteria bacterium]